MQLDDVSRGESDCSELRNVSLGSTSLTIKVECDLSTGELYLEGLSQIVLDGLFDRGEAESVAEGPLSVSLGRFCEAVDGQGCNVSAGVAEDEFVLRRGWSGVFVDGRPTLLPLMKAFDGGSLDTFSEDEVDLVRSGDNLLDAHVFESLELLLLRAGLVGWSKVVDADCVELWIDAKSNQNVELKFGSPDGDGLGALWVVQLEGLVVCYLDGWGQGTDEGARADVDGCVHLGAAEPGSHGICFVVGWLDCGNFLVVEYVCRGESL